MKELLKQLEFKPVTGNLWKHKKIGIIHVAHDDTPSDLVEMIYKRGCSETEILIQTAIGIKSVV